MGERGTRKPLKRCLDLLGLVSSERLCGWKVDVGSGESKEGGRPQGQWFG